jgi:hypothetical protein
VEVILKQFFSKETVQPALIAVVAAALIALGAAGSATAATPAPYFNGFETDTNGWTGANRVASGSNGVTSASGAYHAEAVGGPFTNWGGYTNEFPASGYTTEVDIYLDPASGAVNDTRFDWTSAISTPAGTHRRDFVFNGGYYDDATGPGAGEPRFVFSASTNSGRGSSFPKNPARDPIAITEAGWYTFQHHFYDDGTGVLAVDLTILDAGGAVVHTWTLSDPSDVIGVTVGGNRYGWFATNEFSFLAFDNSRLSVAVGPPTSADQCKQGGWEQFNTPRTFKNQGDCVSFAQNGK